MLLSLSSPLPLCPDVRGGILENLSSKMAEYNTSEKSFTGTAALLCHSLIVPPKFRFSGVGFRN